MHAAKTDGRPLPSLLERPIPMGLIISVQYCASGLLLCIQKLSWLPCPPSSPAREDCPPVADPH